MLGKSLLISIIVILSLFAGFVGYASYITFNDSLVVEDRSLENGARIEWTDCWFNKEEAAFKKHRIFCAWMHTAVSEKTKKSEFKLPVIVIRYTGFDYKDDPVLFMAGGPGSSALIDEFNLKEYWLKSFEKSNFKRDLIIFDQRGSGLSEPRLRCPDLGNVISEILERAATPAENAKFRYEALKGCHDYLSQNSYPIDELGTIYSAEDASHLMDLLGYEKWNLQGVSYSTRLAMEVQRLVPDKVRSMVLDSVYPVNKHLFKEWPELLNKSIDRVLQYCDRSNACKKQHGDLSEKLWSVVERLQKKPMTVEVDPVEGLSVDKVVVNDETLLAILFDAQYHSGALAELPELIDAFHSKKLDLIKPYITEYISYQFDPSFSEAVFWVVECNDNKSFSKDETADIYKQYPRLKRYLVEDYDACDIWTSPQRREIKPVVSGLKVPVLILAGEDDPVTPAEWANEISKLYDNSFLFSFGGIAHSVLDSMPCSNELFRQFIVDPEKRPAADCRKGYVYFPPEEE